MTQETFNEAILVVDDEKDLTDLFTDILTEKGFKVFAAQNGRDALAILSQQQLFMVISDLKMPELNGIDLCKEVRAVRPLLPFILLTDAADKELAVAVAVAGVRAGVTDFLDKPISSKLLIEVVQKFATMHQVEIERDRVELALLRNVFVEESLDLLANFEHSVMALETEPLDKSEFDRLFRKVHTIKGSAGPLQGAEALAKHAHAFENSLSALKTGALSVTADLITLMLQSGDLMKGYLQKMQRDEPPPEMDFLTQQYVALMSINGAAKPSPNKGPTPPIKASSASDDEDDDGGVVVSNAKLDHFLQLAGRMVAHKNAFHGLVRHLGQGGKVNSKDLEELYTPLAKLSEEMQMHIMEIRKVTLQRACAKLPRIIRQTALSLGKQVRLDIVGQELAVDRTVAKALAGALVHIVRNSVDHGIEAPAVRNTKGKPVQGRILINVQIVSGQVLVSIQDDGAGLKREKLVAKAIANNLIDPTAASTLSDQTVFELLFLPNFSTAEKVTDISGRGIGMDVVKSAIVSVGGTVTLSSVPDQSTTISIIIPIPKTVVVEDSILVRINEVLLVVPLNCIADIKPMVRADLTLVSSQWTCQHHGVTIPIGSYADFLTMTPPGQVTARDVKEGGIVVVVSHKDRCLALRVDAVVDQFEAVVLPFEAAIGNIPGFKGTSNLPGNEMAYVLSAEELLNIAFSRRLDSVAATQKSA